MKATSIAVVIVLLIVLGAGVWYFLSRQSSTNTSSTTTTTPTTTTPPSTTPSTSSSTCPAASQLPMNVTINYSIGQFSSSDAKVTLSDSKFCVPKGATVTFKGANLWVASDPHPTHTDLSGLDALGAKDSYSFKFDTVGTHGFHNHLRATDTGTIVVVQ